MPPAQILAVCALIALGYYGGRPIAHGTVVAAKKTEHVVTQPFRHPKKDIKFAGHWIKGDR